MLLSFENAGLPSYFTVSNATATITEDTATNGNKSLMLTSTTTRESLEVTIEFLADAFADPTVDAIAFDAKASANQVNFRRYSWRSHNNGQYVNVPYDIENTDYPDSGVLTTWKTFYFLRSDYNHWVASNTTKQNFMIVDQVSAGYVLYIDNIRPVAFNSVYGFEGGALRKKDSDSAAYYSPSTILGTNGYANGNWMVAFSGSVITAASITYDNVSEGMRAIQVTKTAGTMNIYMPKGRGMLEDVIANDYLAIDVYVPAGVNATYEIVNGGTQFTTVSLKAGAWNTVYIRSPLSALNEYPLKITDTTGGIYVIDNIRGITVEEYNKAVWDFEISGGGLRDDTSVFYYYAGVDHKSAGSPHFGIAVQKSDATFENPHFDHEIVHSGTTSFAFTKTIGYIALSIKRASSYGDSYLLKNGFTFWIYSTVSINGTGTLNFSNGHTQKLNGGEGQFVTKNQWVQITIRPEDINDNGRFLIIQGSTAGTFYLDGFEPLPAE